MYFFLFTPVALNAVRQNKKQTTAFALIITCVFALMLYADNCSKSGRLQRFASRNGLKMYYFKHNRQSYARFVFSDITSGNSAGTYSKTRKNGTQDESPFKNHANYKSIDHLQNIFTNFRLLGESGDAKNINVQMVFIGYDATDDAMGKIAEIDYLEGVSFFDCILDFAFIETYKSTSSFFCFGMQNCSINASTVQSVSKNTSIKWLNVSFCELSEMDFACLCMIPNLERIELTNTVKNGRWIKHLLQAKKMEHIRILGLNSLDNDSAQYLSELKQLKTLEISGCDLTQVDILFLEKLKNLKNLVLTSSKITTNQVEYLKRLSNLHVTGIVPAQRLAHEQKTPVETAEPE